MHKYMLACLLMMGSSALFAQKNNYAPVQVQIEQGLIEGNYDPTTGMQYFFGIPFAKPPVGPLRWKAPQPVDKWTGVKKTKQFGPRPVQSNVFGDMQSRSDGLNEDCLYLNVWASGGKNAKNLPVLVYFYGGGFVAGDGSEPRYDGESMARKGMVVVTVNYRLNVFGFLAHPELSAESPYKSSGNYGLLDQVAGLKWVQKNIAKFGGDPRRVTIAGESAGSISVSLQMASPLSKGLFAGAIGESGASIHPTLAPVSLKDAEKNGMDFARKAGYPSLAELRKLSTKELFELYKESGRFGFPAVIDQYFLTNSLPEVFEAKKQAMVPLLLGWNSAEVPAGAFMYGQPNTKDSYLKRLKQEYPNSWEEALKLYPAEADKDVEWAATNLASDRFISYSTWKWFDLHVNNSSQPVYRYLFSRVRPPLVNQDMVPGLAGGTVKKNGEGIKLPPPLGAPHASEIEYCMGNLLLVKDYAWTDEDFKTSQVMQDYFANFIIHGNPNGPKLPQWPAARPGDSSPNVMVINTESQSVKAGDDNRYLFLDKAYGNKK